MQAKIGTFFLMIGLVVAVVFGGCYLGAMEDTANKQAQVAQWEAETARYEAETTQAQLELEKARAELEVAKGQREVLEASARAVDNNTKLVSYYAHRNDRRLVLVIFSVFGLMACSGGFLVVYKRINGEKSQTTNETN